MIFSTHTKKNIWIHLRLTKILICNVYINSVYIYIALCKISLHNLCRLNLEKWYFDTFFLTQYIHNTGEKSQRKKRDEEEKYYETALCM
jgi:thymidylate kinase